MKAIKKQFVSSNKALANTLIKMLLGITHYKSKSVQEQIMEIRDITAQLRSPDVKIKSFLVYFILNSLPSKYGPFKISYNIHKKKWPINKLLTMCVQEEERLKHETPQSAHYINHVKQNGKKSKGVPLKRKQVCK